MKLLVPLILLGLLAPTPALGMSAAHDAAKRKPKVVKCKKGQVRVKVKKRVRCQSMKAALPRPKAGSERLLLAQSALGTDWSGLRDRRGRRAPSMAKLFRRVSPKALRSVQRALPRTLVLQDRVAGPAAKCARDLKFPPGKDSASFSEKSGNLSLEAKVSLDAIELSIGNKDKRVDMAFDMCKISESVQVPACPTAQGVVDATKVMAARITIDLLEEGKVVESFTYEIDGTTKLHGQTADDAKLDYVEIDDTQKLKQSSPSKGILIGAASVSGNFVRHTKVDMRSRPERYTPQETDVSMDASIGGLAGLLVGREFKVNATRQLKRSSDKLFADTVAKAIETYRERETGWNEPNKCAELTFDPVSDSLKLRKGQTGKFKGKIKAKDNGDPGGKWTRTGQANGTFTPDSAEGGNPQFDYTVTREGQGVVVSATFRVTSKAGVASDTWSQSAETVDDLYYRVTSASSSDHFTGSGSTPNSACNLSGVSTDADVTNAATYGNVFEPSNHLEGSPESGLHGQIFVNTMGHNTGTAHGCDLAIGPPFPACTATIDGQVGATAGAYVDIEPGSQTAKLTWPLPPAVPNYFGSDEPTCATELLGVFDVATMDTTTVPASTFLSDTSQTISHTTTRQGTGAPGTHGGSTVSYTVTFERVREDGSPL